jgi:hypothetical protein
MRAPRRRRPLVRVIGTIPAGIDLTQLAARAQYVGSPEHKDVPSFAGHPKPRADAAICDRSLADSQTQITQWLRDALTRGVVGGPWEGAFPRYVWHLEGGIVFEGRLVNRIQGQYKGYPLNEDEWPPHIAEYYV